MNIKTLLPYDRYTLSTSLNEGEVRRRLEANVSPQKKAFSLVVRRYGYGQSQQKNTDGKPYEGVVVGPRFEIARVINYKNSFLPVTKGEMSTFLGQTEIKVKSSPHMAVMIFSGVWLLMAAFGCAAMVVASINDGFEPMMLLPFAMFGFGCLLFTIPYKLEAKKTKRFLMELLEAGEVKEN